MPVDRVARAFNQIRLPYDLHAESIVIDAVCPLVMK
jgi:hypothetical protein